MLDEFRTILMDDFKKPNFVSQCITYFKEIKQSPNESVSDFDEIFKTLMARVSFHMYDVQHEEWFIVSLLPHIGVSLMKQNNVSYSEPLECAMKLEDSLIREIGDAIIQIQS